MRCIVVARNTYATFFARRNGYATPKSDRVFPTRIAPFPFSLSEYHSVLKVLQSLTRSLLRQLNLGTQRARLCLKQHKSTTNTVLSLRRFKRRKQ